MWLVRFGFDLVQLGCSLFQEKENEFRFVIRCKMICITDVVY